MFSNVHLPWLKVAKSSTCFKNPSWLKALSQAVQTEHTLFQFFCFMREQWVPLCHFLRQWNATTMGNSSVSTCLLFFFLYFGLHTSVKYDLREWEMSQCNASSLLMSVTKRLEGDGSCTAFFWVYKIGKSHVVIFGVCFSSLVTIMLLKFTKLFPNIKKEMLSIKQFPDLGPQMFLEYNSQNLSLLVVLAMTFENCSPGTSWVHILEPLP